MNILLEDLTAILEISNQLTKHIRKLIKEHGWSHDDTVYAMMASVCSLARVMDLSDQELVMDFEHAMNIVKNRTVDKDNLC